MVISGVLIYTVIRFRLTSLAKCQLGFVLYGPISFRPNFFLNLAWIL